MLVSNVKVLCVGVITMDTIALVDKYPGEDERVVAREIVRAGGGPAAVAAVALSRLGISTAIAGTIGNDSDGAEILEIFKREGVDTSSISFSSIPTSASVIVASSENSSRAISTRQPIVQEPFNESAQRIAQSADWIHCDHVGIGRLKELGVARGNGPKISFDAGYGVEKFDVSQVDLFVPTDRQMALRHPDLNLESALAEDARGGRCVVVATQGGAGSSGYDQKFVQSKGFKVPIVSTLGAGDVFHGALLAQVIENRTLEESLRRANAVAALSCRALDGQSAIPTVTELNTYLEEEK